MYPLKRGSTSFLGEMTVAMGRMTLNSYAKDSSCISGAERKERKESYSHGWPGFWQVETSRGHEPECRDS
mgnify:CR=1 FL=1